MMRRFLADWLLMIVVTFTLLSIASLTPRKWGNELPASCESQVCVANRGFHTDLLLSPVEGIFNGNNYLTPLDVGTDLSTSYKYFGFGWGDRHFFMNPPKGIESLVFLGFKALFLPTSSVMRVQGHLALPQDQEVKCVGVSGRDYVKLVKFIEDSFQLDNQGRKILISYHSQPQTRFYQAKGSYSLLRTSNSWTAEGLRSAKVNTPLWGGISSAIMFHLNRVCPSLLTGSKKSLNSSTKI